MTEEIGASGADEREMRRNASRNEVELDVRLPWCPTFRMRRGVVDASVAAAARTRCRRLRSAGIRPRRRRSAGRQSRRCGPSGAPTRAAADAPPRRPPRPLRADHPATTVRQSTPRARASARNRCRSGLRGTGNTLPDLPRREVRQHRPGATDVIEVGVRDREPVEAANPERPERRRHDAAADVERPRGAAGVDEQRPASGKLDGNRFALPDVDDRDAQPVLRRARSTEAPSRSSSSQRTANRKPGAAQRAVAARPESAMAHAR